MRILVINGPNLNMLGKREPEVYGNVTLEEIESLMIEASSDQDVELEFYQSNHEGEIVTRIQQAEQDCEALIINPAAFTHTSVAIRDALASVSRSVLDFRYYSIRDLMIASYGILVGSSSVPFSLGY